MTVDEIAEIAEQEMPKVPHEKMLKAVKALIRENQEPQTKSKEVETTAENQKEQS